MIEKQISFIGAKYDVTGTDNSRIYILMALQGSALGVDDLPEEEYKHWFSTIVKSFGLRATVTTSGITGLSRIELNYHRPEQLTEHRPVTWTPRLAFIPPQESLLDNISDAATKILNQINQMDLSAAWSNVAASVESLARTVNAAETMLESRQNDIDRMGDDFSSAANSIKQMAAELKHNPSLIIRDRKPVRLEETE